MFQKDLLANEKILVTGGGTGLGKAMSQHFLSLGAEVVICGRRESVLKETTEEFNQASPGKASFYACDIRNNDNITEMLDDIWKEKPLTGLVNNAAGNFAAKTEDLSHRAVDAVLNIVLHGTSYMTLNCGKRWIKEGSPGTVLNIVTTYAWTGSAYVVPSAMAKAGVLALTRSLAVEWGNRGIRTNAVAPGPFPTKGAWDRLMPGNSVEKLMLERNPLKRLGKHQELAHLCSFLMSPLSSFINGDCITIDGGEWLKGAGQFNFLEAVTDKQWSELKNSSK